MELLAFRLHPLNSRLKSSAIVYQTLGHSSRFDIVLSPREKALRIRARGLEGAVLPMSTVFSISVARSVVAGMRDEWRTLCYQNLKSRCLM